MSFKFKIFFGCSVCRSSFKNMMEIMYIHELRKECSILMIFKSVFYSITSTSIFINFLYIKIKKENSILNFDDMWM